MTTDTFTLPQLTMADVVSFHRNGFMAIEQLTTPDDLQRVRELLDGLFDRFDELPKNLAFDLGDKKLHDGPQVTPQINGATNFEPRLKETATFERASQFAKQLLGEDATFRFDHAIYKPGNNNRETPWHQDIAYGRINPNPISWNVAFWIPLQDATVDSGCMQFIPSSNLGNLLPHHPLEHNPVYHTLQTGQADTQQAVACPVPAGGATAHLPRTLHYTGPNVTEQPRRAWILNFACNLTVNQPPAQQADT